MVHEFFVRYFFVIFTKRNNLHMLPRKTGDQPFNETIYFPMLVKSTGVEHTRKIMLR